MRLTILDTRMSGQRTPHTTEPAHDGAPYGPLNYDRFTGDDTPLLPTAADEETAAEAEQHGDQFCEWFARCTRLATETRPHPVLGPVPICPPCQGRMNRL